MIRHPKPVFEKCIGAAAEDLGVALPLAWDRLLDRAGAIAQLFGVIVAMPDPGEWPMPTRSW